ncbi:MAG: 3-deoxy-manno-octulosonate cytidylyltransferase [Gammaproteobacteria bacterium]|nr:3-deoxy-manno-octulosonate cytidylyltransferase [Gammaproteobacteria bacterium]
MAEQANSNSAQGFHVVIPARHAAQRLPGKPLLEIAGRPMVVHVWMRAQAAGADEVWIATDDERIATVARQAGAEVMLTDPGHASGTDRVAEVAARRGWDPAAVVVNVQGDEPLIPPANIRQVAALCGSAPEIAIATLGVPLDSAEALADPNTVKLVTAADGRALYFSRAPIPYVRDAGGAAGATPLLHRRHVGLYAYRVAALRQLATTAPCPLEQAEKLEQLRALWLGMRIQVADAAEPPPAGVDTREDLARVRAIAQAAAARADTGRH